MSKEVWAAVDQFFAPILGADAALDAALAASEAAGLPPIQVTPHQGKLLHLLTRITGARRVLEIGTLGAYSTIWIARALPSGGSIVTLEGDPKHAEVARANLERAGVAALVDLRLGNAHDTLPKLAAESNAPFDLVFIDADKKSIPEYFAWALDHTRRGGVIIVDNVVRGGEVANPDTTDPDVKGVQRFAAQLAAEPRASGALVQTVGAKSYDGFALVLVQG
jgi:predicted O-methyltransferase YrrM